MPTPDGRHIAALVLTHNAPAAIGRCINAIFEQTAPPDSILVVDNCSDPPVTESQLPAGNTPIRIIRSNVNTGPAGGWALALSEFLAGKDDLAWVMDDDNVPDPTCLAELADVSVKTGDRTFLFPLWIQPDGSCPDSGAWCGFLISRAAVEDVGLPREDLFWFAEDSEYTRIRLPRAGYPSRRVMRAVVHHLPARHYQAIPVWKYYYEARNLTYLHMYITRRVGWYPRTLMVLVGRAVLEPGGRTRRLMAIGKGLGHGATQRLGIRFPVDALHEAPRKPSHWRGKEGIRAMVYRSWTPDLLHARDGTGEPGSAGRADRVADDEGA